MLAHAPEALRSDQEHESYNNDHQPLEGREYRNSKTAKFAPGEHWNALLVLLESSGSSRCRQMFIHWTVATRDRSVAASQRKFDAEGTYRVNRKLIREEEKQATREKENAIKREKYHLARAAEGKKTRRNLDLSRMSAEEAAAREKVQAAKRQRDKRKRDEEARV